MFMDERNMANGSYAGTGEAELSAGELRNDGADFRETDYMTDRARKRKKVLTIIIVCAVAIFFLAGFGRTFINPIGIVRVEIENIGCAGGGSEEVEVGDAVKAMLLCSLSRYTGKPTADPQCNAVTLRFHYWDDSEFAICPGSRTRIQAEPQFGERFWVENRLLMEYLDELAEKYDLPEW